MFREIVKNALTRGVKVILQAQEITGDDELFEEKRVYSDKPSLKEVRTIFGKGKTSRKDKAVAAFVLSRKAVRATIAGYKHSFETVLLEVIRTLPMEEQFRVLKFVNSFKGPRTYDTLGRRSSSPLDNLDVELLASIWESAPDVSRVFDSRSIMPRADTPRSGSFPTQRGYREDLGWRVDFSPASDEEGAQELLRTGNYRWVLVPDELREGNRKFALDTKVASKSLYKVRKEPEEHQLEGKPLRQGKGPVKHVRAVPPLNTILVSVEDEYERNTAYRGAPPEDIANDEGGTASSATTELSNLWGVFPAFTEAPNEREALLAGVLAVGGRISEDAYEGELKGLMGLSVEELREFLKTKKEDSELNAMWESVEVPVEKLTEEGLFGKKPRSRKKKAG